MRPSQAETDDAQFAQGSETVSRDFCVGQIQFSQLPPTLEVAKLGIRDFATTETKSLEGLIPNRVRKCNIPF